MKKEVIYFALLGVLFLFVLSGCTSTNIENYKSKYGLHFLAGLAVSCNQDADCGTGYICESGSCKLGCLADSDCSSGTCDINTGRCIQKGECSSDKDCQKRCDLSLKKCVECLEQEDCDENSICNFNTNKCEPSPESKEPPTSPSTTTAPPSEPVPEPAKEMIFKLKKGESTKVPLKLWPIGGFILKLTDADYGPPGNYIRYELRKSNEEYITYGLVSLGHIVINDWWQLQGATFLIVPVDREGETVTFKVKECKNTDDPNCFDGCKDFSYNNKKYVEGKLLTWPQSKQRQCAYKLIDTGEQQKPSQEVICEDPDGDNRFVKGTTKGIFDSTLKTVTDTCLNENYVTENICIDYQGKKIVALKNIECRKGCKDGACSPEETPTLKEGLTVTLKEGESIQIPLYYGDIFNGIFKLGKVDSGEPNHEVSYLWTQTTGYPAGSGAMGLGAILVIENPILKTYLATNPVSRTKDSATWIIKECKDIYDPRCIDRNCPDYTYGENQFINGKYSNLDAAAKLSRCTYQLKERGAIFYEDLDKDSYGNPQAQKSAPAKPEGYVDNNLDCNDKLANVNPSAIEICDKIDNNCNSEIDEGNVCKPKSTCEDPDGDNINQAGIVTYLTPDGKTNTFTDSCIGLVGVLEGLCTQDGKFACENQENCRRRCPAGYICSNGACKQTSTKCTDQDGENKNSKSTVAYTDEKGSSKTIEDTCIGYRFVEESVCNTINQGRTKILKCSGDEVCLNGACVKSKESCSDSDAKERKTKGTVKYTDKEGKQNTFTDSCDGESNVNEGICKLNTFMSRKVSCPPGTRCSDGACIEGALKTEPFCQDSDGVDIYTLGKVTFYDETSKSVVTVEDVCYSQGEFVSEKVCIGNQMRVYSRFCEGGYCSEGACVKSRR